MREQPQQGIVVNEQGHPAEPRGPDTQGLAPLHGPHGPKRGHPAAGVPVAVLCEPKPRRALATAPPGSLEPAARADRAALGAES